MLKNIYPFLQFSFKNVMYYVVWWKHMQSYNSIIHMRWKNMISVVLHVLDSLFSWEWVGTEEQKKASWNVWVERPVGTPSPEQPPNTPRRKRKRDFPVETRGIHCNKICINRIICTLPFRIIVFHQHNLEFLIKFLCCKSGKMSFLQAKLFIKILIKFSIDRMKL